MKSYGGKTVVWFGQHVVFFVLVIGLNITAIAHGGMEIPLSGQELAEQSDVIITAEVIEQRSKLHEDKRGKHIYTEVTLRPIKTLRGEQISTDITIEVIGGTFEGWREVVSYSPSFEDGEQCVLFLKSAPSFRIVEGRQGKRTIHQGKFIIDGYRISPENFETALRRFDIGRSSGASLRSYIAELGEELGRTTTSDFEQSQNVTLKGSTKEEDIPGAPRDLGGGQLPPSEIPSFKK